MSRVVIRLDALRHNLGVIDRWMENHGATWTVVTKVLCGHLPTLAALQRLGVRSMGDSRLTNLRALQRIDPTIIGWYLRVPTPSAIPSVVRRCEVSLNSETCIIEAIEAEAGRQGRKHGIIIMIELGDLREGILPASLIRFYAHVFDLPHIEVLGIGTNLGCLSGAVPTVDQFMQLVLYRELLEIKFGRRLPLISAGTTAVLPLVVSRQLPRAINHFRIGEALFLGTDLINGGVLPGLRDDAVFLEGEIAEIKMKGLVPLVETAAMTPFGAEGGANAKTAPGQRGYRALVNVGQLDADIAGIAPLDPRFRIAGASSDLTVVNLGDDAAGLKVGDSIAFRMNYAAMLRLMSGRYIEKQLIPSHEDSGERSGQGDATHACLAATVTPPRLNA